MSLQVPKFRFIIQEGRELGEREVPPTGILHMHFRWIYKCWSCNAHVIIARHCEMDISSSSFWQVENPLNHVFAMQYCASFAHDLPRRREIEDVVWNGNVQKPAFIKYIIAQLTNCLIESCCWPFWTHFQEALKFTSLTFKLNPWQNVQKHQDVAVAIMQTIHHRVELTWTSCKTFVRKSDIVQDWAAIEAGVTQALGSWCLDRFQRNPSARPVNRWNSQSVSAYFWFIMHFSSIARFF